jgi:alkylation response protein AidB-like acyl-CoA dehydrogenase
MTEYRVNESKLREQQQEEAREDSCATQSSGHLYIRIEATRSLLFQVAASNDAYCIDPALAIATKAKASEEALAVTEACIQLHGAIGFTDEHDIGLYLKRAMLLSSLLGNAAAQRRRYVTIADLTA